MERRCFNIARLWQSGFELNSTTAGVEFSTVTGATIDVTHIRSGTYAGRISSLVSATSQLFKYQFSSVVAAGPYYTRFYVYFVTLPSAENRIMSFSAITSGSHGSASDVTNITVDNTGILRLRNGAVQLGSNSSALNTNQWYRIEVFYDPAHTTATALIDGVQFATSGAASSSNVASLFFGGNLKLETQTTGEWWFEDIALNDSTASNQTSYPGAGGIIHLQPNAAGDNNAFTVQVGGTAGAANNYTRVNEITPDDITSYNGDVTSGDIDDFAMTATPSSIGSSDTINVVAVGVRYRAAVAASEAAFEARIKKVTGGTVSLSAAITPTSTTWVTNANAAPRNYPLVLYLDPDNSLAWTKATLDTAQVGYTISTTNTNAADISTVWVSVDFTPAAAVNTAQFMPFFPLGW